MFYWYTLPLEWCIANQKRTEGICRSLPRWIIDSVFTFTPLFSIKCRWEWKPVWVPIKAEMAYAAHIPCFDTSDVESPRGSGKPLFRHDPYRTLTDGPSSSALCRVCSITNKMNDMLHFVAQNQFTARSLPLPLQDIRMWCHENTIVDFWADVCAMGRGGKRPPFWRIGTSLQLSERISGVKLKTIDCLAASGPLAAAKDTLHLRGSWCFLSV